MFFRISLYMFLLTLTGLLACNSPAPQATDPETTVVTSTSDTLAGFVQPIAAFHGHDAWQEKEALRYDFLLEFGGEERLKAKVLMRTDMSEIHMRKANGTKLTYTRDTAFVSPVESDHRRARFDLLTWPYFLAAPFKFDDPGTRITPLGEEELLGKTYETAKLTFEPGTGDAPDDWYILFRDQETGHLKAMTYIVTYGKTAEDAVDTPHCIVYDDFEEVEGVLLPQTWTFYEWTEETGLGEKIGHAKLGNFTFTQPEATAFSVADDYRIDEVPVAY